MTSGQRRRSASTSRPTTPSTKIPNPDVVMARVSRTTAIAIRPRPGSAEPGSAKPGSAEPGGPTSRRGSSRMSAPSPSAVAPMNPIWIPQNRFSKPLPNSRTIAAAASATSGPLDRRTSTRTSAATMTWRIATRARYGRYEAEPERPEHQPIRDDRRPEPVLVERREPVVERDRPPLDDRPLVGEERHPAAEADQQRDRRRRPGPRRSVSSGCPQSRPLPGCATTAPSPPVTPQPPGAMSARRAARAPPNATAVMTSDPTMLTTPSAGSSAAISVVGGTAARRFSVNATENTTQPQHRAPVREEQDEEDECRVCVPLVHRREGREGDERRRHEAEGQALGCRAAQDRGDDHEFEQHRHRDPDVAQRQWTRERDRVGHEVTAGGDDLEDPPRVPGAEREDGEDVALVGRRGSAGSSSARPPRRTAATGRRPSRHPPPPDGTHPATRPAPRTTPRTGRGAATPAASS